VSPVSRVINRSGVLAAVLAAALAVATDGAYGALIISQHVTGQPVGSVPFVTLYIAAIACAAVVAVTLMLQDKRSAARALLVSATTGSAALGSLAIFSIGLPLLITAVLLGVAAFQLEQNLRAPIAWAPALIGSAIAIAVLVAGFVASHVFWGA
jgi:hypothetical protein